jgi:hypothetical protein
MKRAILAILAACAAALMVWRLTRSEVDPTVLWPEPEDGLDGVTDQVAP